MNIVKFGTDTEHEDSNALCMKFCLQVNDCECGIDPKLRDWVREI
jgi:hypothetical protein